MNLCVCAVYGYFVFIAGISYLDLKNAPWKMYPQKIIEYVLLWNDKIIFKKRTLKIPLKSWKS